MGWAVRRNVVLPPVDRLRAVCKHGVIECKHPHMDQWLEDLEVFCADVGSIAQSKFAWARRHLTGEDEELHSPASIDSLARAVIHQLTLHRPVALGFEMPLVVPVTEASSDLGRARPCDKGRTAWSQSAGASVMATGLVQLAWVLHQTHSSIAAPIYLNWNRFSADRTGLFIWEAFVNGPDKDPQGSHEADALIGVRAFCDQLPNPGDPRAHEIERPLSLAATAAAWAGWEPDIEELRAPVVVVRP